MTRQETESHPNPMECVFQRHLNRKAGNNSLKLCNPAIFEPRGRQAETMVCRAKSEELFGQGTCAVGWIELRQQTKSFTAFIATSPTVPKQEI